MRDPGGFCILGGVRWSRWWTAGGGGWGGRGSAEALGAGLGARGQSGGWAAALKRRPGSGRRWAGAVKAALRVAAGHERWAAWRGCDRGEWQLPATGAGDVAWCALL